MAGSVQVSLIDDPTIMERNLLFEDLERNDELDHLIATLNNEEVKPKSDDTPWKLVKPSPGFLIKTRSESGEKIFLNICHTKEIPAPQEITDAELVQILQSEEPSTYRLPMSIGDVHEEMDKSQCRSCVVDIAINSSFFSKVESNQLFRSFLITVAMEGMADKYNKLIDPNDYVILKNRKVMGTLQLHRIQKRGEGNKNTLIEVLASEELKENKRRFRIVRDPPHGVPELLTVEVLVKDVNSGKCLLLDVGEDRVVLRSANKPGSLLDIFLPYSVDQDNVCALFNVDKQIVTVKLPVVYQ